jgi:hypothetical protein
MSIFPSPPLVVVETPFRATQYYSQEQHRLYLLHALADSYKRGEAPFASHHLATEVLNDDDDYERSLGIRCGKAWGKYADIIAVYSDLSCSDGMKDAIAYYRSLSKPIEWRKLPDKVVASIKQFGEFTLEETPDESILYPSGAAVPHNGG